VDAKHREYHALSELEDGFMLSSNSSWGLFFLRDIHILLAFCFSANALP